MPPRPLPVIGGVVRASVQGICPSGQPWVNVWHFQYANGASAPGSVEIGALDTQFYKFYGGPGLSTGQPVMASCKSTCSIQQIAYTPLDGVSNTLTFSHALNGSAGSALSTPSEVAMVLTLRTALRGRRNRGRVYLPPFGNDFWDTNGFLSTSGLVATKLITQWTALQGLINPLQWTHVVASYGHGTANGVPTTWAPYATPITNVTMDTKADAQRRRK